MRILDLHLERFGPFTDRRLTLRQDARLHVIYGANEAGKSCSLAAVTDLLFGIPTRTSHDFIHPARDLRIGGTIADRAGRTLTFRRKKNRPLLVDGADVALPDDALAPFLGGLSREVFCRAFGLDAAALRASGDDLQKTDGELGAALFSAASGLRGLNDLRANLDKDADAIFAPRASKDRAFFQALARYDAARATLRQAEVRSGPLKALRDEIEGYRTTQADLTVKKAGIAQERGRLERVRRAAPIIRQIDLAEAQLATLADCPEVTEGFSASLSAALAEMAAATDRASTARLAQETHLANAAALVADSAILLHAEDIDRLAGGTGSWTKGRSDLPRVQAEADGFTAELEALAVRLGLADAAQVRDRQPTDAARASLEALLEEGAGLEADLKAARLTHARETARLSEHIDARKTQAALRDPVPLRDALDALRETLKQAETARALAADIALDRQSLGEDAARLVPPVRDLDALASRPLPSRDSIATARQVLDALDQTVQRTSDAANDCRRSLEALADRIAQLDAMKPVASAERIEAVRAARNSAWHALRDTLFGTGPLLTGGALASTAARFETDLQSADTLADEAVADAGRVAEHALAGRDQARRIVELARAEADHQAALAARDQAWADWLALWSEAGFKPRTPAEMLGWRGQVELLLERRARLATRDAQRAALDASAQALEAPLAALAETMGLPVSGLQPSIMAVRLDTEIKRMAALWQEAREAETLLTDMKRRVDVAARAVEAAAAALSQWSGRLRAAVPGIGLSADATPIESREALRAWNEVPAAIKAEADRARRVAGIRRDLADFESDVATLAANVAPDLAGSPPDAILRVLKQRLVSARDTRTRREEIDRQVETAKGERQSAELALTRAASAVHELSARAGLDSSADLAGIAQRLASRDALLAALRDKRDQLALATDGMDEALLRDALLDYDHDRCDAELARLTEDEVACDRAGQEAFAALDRAKGRLAALEDGGLAEIAVQQRRGAEAELIAAGREWAVLSLGALLLGEAIDRQRSSRQEPLLAKAGDLFSRLTGADFLGLSQSFDERDVPHLVGRRANGREVALSEMSEGTRDQLYLALRLAYLSDYATRAEPAPFIADDLFMTFDDERTGHGLRALADIGDTVQPILFTHHRYVVDAARRELGSTVEIIDL